MPQSCNYIPPPPLCIPPLNCMHDESSGTLQAITREWDHSHLITRQDQQARQAAKQLCSRAFAAPATAGRQQAAASGRSLLHSDRLDLLKYEQTCGVVVECAYAGRGPAAAHQQTTAGQLTLQAQLTTAGSTLSRPPVLTVMVRGFETSVDASAETSLAKSVPSDGCARGGVRACVLVCVGVCWCVFACWASVRVWLLADPTQCAAGGACRARVCVRGGQVTCAWSHQVGCRQPQTAKLHLSSPTCPG